MSAGAGPPDCRHTNRATAGSALFSARMSSENCPLDCLASTAPKVPQQSPSWIPLHLTHRLIVPAVAAFRPPPPATLTYWDDAPLNASAPPAVPFLSVVATTPPMREPLVPLVAAASPL